jgi:hypothetical protein
LGQDLFVTFGFPKIGHGHMENNDLDASQSIFDLNPEQRAARLQPATDQVKKDIFAAGLPLVYQDDHCPTESYFIHEYEDGRTYLMLMDMDTRTFTLIKDLTHA